MRGAVTGDIILSRSFQKDQATGVDLLTNRYNMQDIKICTGPYMVMASLKECIKEMRYRFKSVLHRDSVALSPPQKSDKNLLLSYVTHPFRIDPEDPSFFSHAATWECQEIARIWVDKGYNVDVIDWDNSYFLPKKKYSVFIDIHSNMERLAPLLGKDCKKILHITGAHWRFQNAAELRRLSELESRRGIRLQPRRQVPPSLGIEYADCATILGNEFTQGTFAYAHKPLYPIPLSTTVQFPFMEKDFGKIRRNFLWLGSGGMVHKGLDLVLDAFSKLPDYNLVVCGPVHQEPDFEKAYYEELYRSPNIRTLGFTDVTGTQFQEIVKNSCGLVYPSCSEGQAGSVITCLHAGLIPVISYESGVDIGDFGILLEKCSVKEITAAVEKLSGKSADELAMMSKMGWQYARTHHTRKKFAQQYGIFVEKITSEMC